ncbi:MAG: 3-keto-5-aminohexanoate cleavage protein [Fibrobacteria bacterium]|nr:3-keto-5-aminohexanoate cleavage protein [Fibrobacteria bacterium]
MDEMIICIAPYPGEKQEERFPGKMDVAQEVIDSCNAGASIGHLHVRDEEGLQTIDTTFFQRDIEKIRANCPIIIEGSTGGAPEHTLDQRCVSFNVPGIEMGSLNFGSINMYDGVYNNQLSDIYFYANKLKEKNIVPFNIVFDLSHFYNVPKLIEDGLIKPPYTFNFVYDVPNALPYKDEYLDLFIDHLPDDSIWFLTLHWAIGAKSLMRAIEKGGHIRVGYEDGPFLSNGEKSGSNPKLVEDIVKAAEAAGRTIAEPDKAREMMGIAPRK